VLPPLVWLNPAIWPWILLPVVPLGWACWIFRQMTVEVAEGELRAWFGSGWPRYRWPLERIASVRTVHNSFWTGTGIRFAPSGMLYNVASGPGVEFRLRSGATFRLGSDDAEGLAAVIGDAVPEGITAGPAPRRLRQNGVAEALKTQGSALPPVPRHRR
jgi:hypothetical protein